MGLDLAELIMQLEDNFDVDLPNEMWDNLVTVGDLSDGVYQLVGNKKSNECQSTRLFFQLRNDFSERYGVDKHLIRTGTSLEDIIPMDDRQSHWKKLKADLGIRLSGLERSDWLFTILFLICITVPVIFYLYFESLTQDNRYLGTIMSFFLVTIILMLSTNHKAVHFPKSARNMRDLVSRLLILDYEKNSLNTAYSESDIWMIVRSTVANKIDRALEEIHRDSRLVKDLDLG